jgi:DNA repair protein SbcC/Rad50
MDLISVEVTNFRSFSHAVLCPLSAGQGMTAINGVNGSGKSSLVHALMWATYGITPDGVPVRALRRQGSDGEVVVTVTLRHDGQTLEITRALRGRNDTTIASIKVDGIEQTNVSARTATAWVQDRFALDAEGFLVAHVVRQKELDSLVKARPAERRKTIERLAGIERMSAARDLARADARTAGKVLDALPGAEDPTVAQERLDEVTVRAEQAGTAVDAAHARAEQASAARLAAQSALTRAAELSDVVDDAKTRTAMVSQQVQMTRATVERLQASSNAGGDLATAQAQASQARVALSDAEQALTHTRTADAARAGAEQRLAAASGELQRAATDLHDARERAEAVVVPPVPGDLDQLRASAQQALDLANEEHGAATGDWNRATKSLATMQAAHEHGQVTDCPTCARPIEDPDIIIRSLQELLASATARGTAAKAARHAATGELDRLDAVVAAASAAEREVERAQTKVAEAVQVHARAHSAHQQVSAEFAEAAAAAEAAHAASARAEDQLPVLRAAEEQAQRTLRAAERAAEDAVELARQQDALADAEAALAQAEAAQAAAQDALGEVDLTVLQQQVADASAREVDALGVLRAAETTVLLAERDLQEAQGALDRAQASAVTRKRALQDVERTTATAAALDEFRRDRLARLAPELSEVASDFVSRMTDGKYTAVELDEEFTPVLTDATGLQRPVSWLSGGEESAVALALRVAIGEVLSGQRGGLLILDEVLTAQDPGRRQATMAAIRALPRQIITINHVSESTDMVDLVADVVDDGEGASTILTDVPQSGTDLADLDQVDAA